MTQERGKAGFGTEVGEVREIGKKVNEEGFVFLPVRRDLKDGGTADASMGEEKGFLEIGFFVTNTHREGEAAEFGLGGERRGRKGQRHETWAAWSDPEAELVRKAIAEVGRAEFRKRQPASGDDEGRCGEGAQAGLEAEVVGFFDFMDRASAANGDSGGGTFRQEHLDDGAGALIAELLAECFFVVGNAVIFHQSEKIVRAEAGEGGATKGRIGREEILRAGAEVGKIAAPAAGDGNFFAHPFVVFKDDDPATPPTRGEGAHEAGGTASDDDEIGVGW